MPRPKKEAPNRSDGRYEVKVTIGHTVDGKPLRKSYYSAVSKDDAKRLAEEDKTNKQIADIIGSGRPANIDFTTWAYKWLNTYKKDKVSEHTYLFTYKSNLDKYIVPYFQHARLGDIKQADIQKYIDSQKKLSRSTIDKHKMILRDIFEKAIYNDLCYKNPVIDIKVCKKSTPNKSVWTADQAEIAKEYAKKYPRGMGVIIILETGLRRGELCGLRWSDVDWDNKLISVKRSIVPTVGKNVIGDPKTESGIRKIPVSDDFLDWLRTQQEDRESVLSNSNPKTYAKEFAIFMQKLSAECGIPKLSPHEIRHTYATLLRDKGVDLYTIKAVMGHSDIQITANTYVHNDIKTLRKQMHLDDNIT